MIRQSGICILSLICVLSTMAQAEIIRADSCNYQDVQAAVDSANYGDTVLVPAGECEWNEFLTINKGINIQGAGIDKTIININKESKYGYAICFRADKTTAEHNYPFSFSGFTLKETDNFHAFIVVQNSEPSHAINKVRIYNNKLIAFKEDNRVIGFIHSLGVFGVVYNNIVQDVSHVWRFFGKASGWSEVEEWHPGTGNAMYYEDNYALLSENLSRDLIVSGGAGNRYVARYNTVDVSQRLPTKYAQCYDIHGNQENNNTGGIGCEIYGNLRISTAGPWLNHRGGQVFFFFNQWKSTAGHGRIEVWEEFDDDAYSTSICPGGRYKNTGNGHCLQRPRDSYYWRNFAGMEGKEVCSNVLICFDHYHRFNGVVNDPLTIFENDAFFSEHTAAFDGGVDAVGSCGYYGGPVCTKSGIGYGTMEEMEAIEPTAKGLGFWVTSQDCRDISDMVGKSPARPIKGELYRSEYDATSGKYKWELYYRPYIYPHPLREAPLDADICGEGEISGQCWCEGMKSRGHCFHGYYAEDVNQNGQSSIQDVQLVVNAILGIAENSRVDVNGDNRVTINDIQEVVNVIIN